MKRWTWWPQAWLGGCLPGVGPLLVIYTSLMNPFIRDCHELGFPHSVALRKAVSRPKRDTFDMRNDAWTAVVRKFHLNNEDQAVNPLTT